MTSEFFFIFIFFLLSRSDYRSIYPYLTLQDDCNEYCCVVHRRRSPGPGRTPGFLRLASASSRWHSRYPIDVETVIAPFIVDLCKSGLLLALA